MRSAAAAAHNEYQRRYYEARESAAIAPRDARDVRRHLEELLGAACLPRGARVLEVGAGLGRFTALLMAEGLDVVASDLSPVLLARLRQSAGRSLDVLEGDVATLPERTTERFSGALGFFVLHHLFDLDAAFRALAHILHPGAPVAFCEPNGWNPLFYAQIAVTPGMTWKGDGGIRHMRPSVVLSAMRHAGLEDARCGRYGFLPPALARHAAGAAFERALERVRGLEPLRAFQVFSARTPAAPGAATP
jgi:SAM-dependent methyltransferase